MQQTEKKGIKSYIPLAVITLFAMILASLDPEDLNTLVYRFMGYFLVLFSLFKWMDIKGFVEAFTEYDLLTKIFKPYPWIFAILELALGLSYLGNLFILVSNYVLITLMGINFISVLWALIKRRSYACACLGTIIKLPLTVVSFYEILVMMLLAIWMMR